MEPISSKDEDSMANLHTLNGSGRKNKWAIDDNGRKSGTDEPNFGMVLQSDGIISRRSLYKNLEGNKIDKDNSL
jgi:hypothetical protein